MRQIKFRAWDKKYKEMINDIHIAPEYDWLVLSDNDALAERDNRGRGDDDGYELMQFTGILDKNGKEIYEGDVVEYKAYNTWHKDAVRFTDGKFHGNLSGVKEDLQSNYDLGLIVTLGCEVIGNIYENPELLNKNFKQI